MLAATLRRPSSRVSSSLAATGVRPRLWSGAHLLTYVPLVRRHAPQATRGTVACTLAPFQGLHGGESSGCRENRTARVTVLPQCDGACVTRSVKNVFLLFSCAHVIRYHIIITWRNISTIWRRIMQTRAENSSAACMRHKQDNRRYQTLIRRAICFHYDNKVKERGAPNM